MENQVVKDAAVENRTALRVLEREPVENRFSVAKELAEQSGFMPEVVPNRRNVMDVLNKAAVMRWENPELAEQARESLEGFVHSVVNRLRRQALLQVKDLAQVCAENNVAATLRIAQDERWPAKLFAVQSNPPETFQIAGREFNWLVYSIDTADVRVPALFLKRLTVMGQNGMQPDAVFVGLAINPKRASLSRATAEELQTIRAALVKTMNAGKRAIQAQAQALSSIIYHRDPILLAGFGYEPMYLIECGRWE